MHADKLLDAAKPPALQALIQIMVETAGVEPRLKNLRLASILEGTAMHADKLLDAAKPPALQALIQIMVETAGVEPASKAYASKHLQA